MAHFQPSSFSNQFKSLELTSVQPTGKNLGKGADATVQEVNWLGTLCAAKQLHEILLEDDSAGGAKRFIQNFETECMTWSRLVHPCIVQFLGIHFFSATRVPMLILEKMDTSLRNYLEAHKKEEFPLPDKVYVLRQVAQALSYLHSLSPPLVHHDLSPNNVLLNGVSLQTKVTDFGMTRAVDPSKMTRKSSVKGTRAFMAPEALVEPPKYDDKLDVFSYGNVIVTTVTHQWPNPGQYNRVEGGKLVAVSELQRRQQYINQFTPKESELFLPLVRACLQNDPSERPTSIQLVTQMSKFAKSLPRVPNSMVIGQLRQTVDEKDKQLQAKADQTQRFISESGQQWEKIKNLQQQRGHYLLENKGLKTERDRYRQENEQLQYRLGKLEEQLGQQSSVVKKVAKKPQRNWRVTECQKILKCSGCCWSVATKEDLIAVGIGGLGYSSVEVYDKESSELLHVIGRGQLSGDLCGVAFLDEETIVVSDHGRGNLKVFTLKGKLLRTIDRGSTTFKPLGVTVSPDGHIYVCDGDNHCVCAFDVKGKSLFSLGSHGSGDECFDSPSDLCFASDGLLYITDVKNSRICVHDKDGKFIRKFPNTFKPTCIDATDCGHLIVSSVLSNKIMIYTTGGELVVELCERGSKVRQFKYPYGVSVDRDGLVYIVDSYHQRIQIF